MEELAASLSSEMDVGEVLARLDEEYKKAKAASLLTPLTIPTTHITLAEPSSSKPMETEKQNPQILSPSTAAQIHAADPTTHTTILTKSPIKPAAEDREKGQAEVGDRAEEEQRAEVSEGEEEGDEDEEDMEDNEEETEGGKTDETGAGGEIEKAEGSGETQAISEEPTEVLGDEGEKEGEQEVDGEMQDIVVLDADTSVDDRTARRNSRMTRRVAELLTVERSRGREMDPSEEEIEEICVTGETTTGANIEEAAQKEADERAMAERKKKGKQPPKPQQKKPRQASKQVVIREPIPTPIQVPYKLVDEEEDEQEEVEEQANVAGGRRDDIGVYEKDEVVISKKLLDLMGKFKDPKKEAACASRVSKGKMAKSGKKLHLPSL